MKSKTWILVVLLVMMALSLWLNPARAEDGFKVMSFAEMSASDVELPFYRSFGDGSRRMAMAGCYGPFFRYERKNIWLADMISVCGTGVFKIEDQEVDKNQRSTVATVGAELFNVYGLRVHGSYDPMGNEWFGGFGISGSSAWDELTKRWGLLWE